ncbi:MAG: glutamate 5-kinase, partial [Bacillota bacterium]|nr:glutamate 5-kinase [Bacillota bacterium]
MSEAVKKAKRIVFKIGSSTLMSPEGGFDGGVIHQLVALWSDLHKEGRDIILVSSGAIGLGWGDLGLQRKPKAIPEKQAAAAVGQSKLMTMYDSFFSPCGIGVGQVLLTRDDIADRRRYLNARNTLNILIQDRIVPVINENDTVAFEEIKFGENDTLSAMVGGLLDADLVVLLSDIAGLYTGDPRRDPAATLIKEVHIIDD